MLNFDRKQWLRYIVMHPFEGFEDMRWKKSGSLKIAFIIVVLFFSVKSPVTVCMDFSLWQNMIRLSI